MEEKQHKPSLKEGVINVGTKEDRTVMEEETVDDITSLEDSTQLVHEEDKEDKDEKLKTGHEQDKTKDILVEEGDGVFEGQEEKEDKLEMGQEQNEGDNKTEDILAKDGEEDRLTREGGIDDQEEKPKIEARLDEKGEEEEGELETKDLQEGGVTEKKEKPEKIKTEGTALDQEEEEESTTNEEFNDKEGKDDRTQHEGLEKQLKPLLPQTPVNNSVVPETAESNMEKSGLSPAFNYSELKHDHGENNSNNETKKPKASQKEHIDRYKTGTTIKNTLFSIKVLEYVKTFPALTILND